MMICITGTPGVGKTAVAKILADLLSLQHHDLNELARRRGLVKGWDERRKSDIIDEKALKGIRVEGILDGHLSHFCDCDLIVLLRCSNQKEHVERMRKKGWWESKIRENMEAEIMEVVAEEAREEAERKSIPLIEIDTAGKLPEEVAEEIINNLRFGKEI